MRAALALLLLPLAAACSRGETVSEPAMELTGRVVDAANLLSPETEARLEKRLATVERELGPQLVVATTPSLGEKKIEDYSLDLARAWRIGDAKRNDGLFLLVAPNERKVRIEVGYGLENTFTNAVADELLRKHILPSFKTGNFAAGIEQGVDRMIDRMKAARTIPANDNAPAAKANIV
jgi:uncharacterized protein